MSRAQAQDEPLEAEAKPARAAAPERCTAGSLGLSMAAGPLAVGGEMRRYLDRLAWVVRDGAPRHGRQIVLIVVVNVIGLAAAAASLGAVMHFAKQAELGVPVRFAGVVVHLNAEPLTLVLFGSAVAALGIFSAICLYFGEWLILRVTRAYEQASAQRVLEIVGDPGCAGWPGLVEPGASPRAVIGRLMNLGARFVAFAFRDMLRGILTALTFVFAVAVLFVIEWWLTLLLLPAAALYMIPLYLVNRRVASNQMQYRAHSPPARRSIARALRELNTPEASNQPAIVAQAFSSPDFDAMKSALYSRMIADKRVIFLNASFFVACTVALLLYFGNQARAHERPWADLLTYLVALRFAVASLRQVSGLFVKFSRFFPEVRMYSRFVDDAAGLKRRREIALAETAPLPPSIRIRLRERRWDSPGKVDIERGTIIWVLHPMRMTWFDLQHVAGMMFRAARSEALMLERAEYAVGGTGGAESRHGRLTFKTAEAFSQRGGARTDAGYLIVVDHHCDGVPADAGISTVLVADDSNFVAAGDRAWFERHAEEIVRWFRDLRGETPAVEGEVHGDEMDEDAGVME